MVFDLIFILNAIKRGIIASSFHEIRIIQHSHDMTENTNCRICGGMSSLLFGTTVLNKYHVKYYKCNTCQSMMTENPYWLDEAYKNPISEYDTGLVDRNLKFAKRISKIIKNNFEKQQIFLDYGGGYGLFVRLMRDKGFNFYRYDKYEQNLFARHFDFDNVESNTKFSLVTSFELFEHFVNPLEEIEKIFKYSDNILFSTELTPKKNIQSATDWWYFVPEEGQHIVFYTIETLEWIAKYFNAKLSSDGKLLHCLSKEKRKVNLTPITFLAELVFYKLRNLLKGTKETEISFMNDFNYILKRKMNGN